MNRLNFLEVVEEDLEMIRDWRNSQEVSQFMYTNDLISSFQQKKWYEKIKEEEDSRYWIIELENQKVGLAYLNFIDQKNSKCHWGFYLGERTIKGKGLGKDIMNKLAKYIFEELNLNKICSEVLSLNEKVIYLHEKFGFVIEGKLRQHVKKNGDFMDVMTLGLLKNEWEFKNRSLENKT